MRPLRIESLAGSPGFVCGLSVVRGVAVPVVDLGSVLGFESPPNPTRFVILRTEEGEVALSVEEVLGIRELTLDSLHTLPPLLSEAAAEVVSQVGALDIGLLFVLQTAQIVPASVWQTLRSEGNK
jgi:purine-binding chemotaxis protein CheW